VVKFSQNVVKLCLVEARQDARLLARHQPLFAACG